jgi:hypothetical protein
MAYKVDKFNGTIQTTVADGTIDSTTDIRFVGKNYAGYGEVQNENFLHLMENFSNTTPPPKAVTGQIWYDSGEKRLRFYTGTKWKAAGGAEVASSAPSGLERGEFWWDSSAQQLYAWSGTQYVLIGPEASPELGSSAISADTVKDNDTVPGTHAIIKIIAGGEIVAIVNSDPEFVPASSTGLTANFPKIKQGITLRNTNASGVTTSDFTFWGTASDSARLGGQLAASYVLSGSATPFNQAIKFIDAGFFVGDDSDLRVWIENSEDVIVEAKYNNPITFRITNGSIAQNVAIIRDTGVIPGVTDGVISPYNLGSASNNWNTVFASTTISDLKAADLTTAYNKTTKVFTGSFTGNLVANDTTVVFNATTKVFGFSGATFIGDIQGSSTSCSGLSANSNLLAGKEPASTSTGDTVVVRTAGGEINATAFNGIATNTNRVKIDDAASDTTWNGLDQSTWYRSAKTTKTAYSIAARNASGNLLANVFDGTATSAQYADLAEKYLADKDYEPGTVVCVGGEKEVTAATFGDRALGAVSTNPAFMMNKDLEGGTYIALKGRVPVKVTGSIRKGQRLIAAANGCAQASTHHSHSDAFAIALESSDEVGVKLIEAVIL